MSRVLFIATSNNLDTIQGPLLDRLEVIELTGYSLAEKVQIAKKYLVPKQIVNNGLSSNLIQFNEKYLEKIVTGYTAESGVRTLEVIKIINIAEINRRCMQTSSF